MEAYLTKLYYSPSTGLISAPRLYRKAKEDGKKFTLKAVKAWVGKQSLSQQYRLPPKRYFPIYSETPGSYQADLMFYPDNIKRFNGGYGTFMSVIEVTTRRGHLIKMKNKTTAEVLRAFGEFLKEADGTVRALTTDNGSEWISREFRSTCIEAHKIDHKVAETGDHSRLGMVESFNRTIKRLIDRYRTAYKTKVFHTALPQMMANYNASLHSGIKCSPDQCRDSADQQEQVRRTARERSQKMTKSIDLKIGDRVRVMLFKKNIFGKETKSWSDKIYTITGDSPMKTSFLIDDDTDRRYKHYELARVDSKAQTNPYKRDIHPGDLEQHLATMPRQGRGRNDDSRVEPRHTRPTTAASVQPPAPDPQSTKRLADARKTYVGRRFRDGGVTWQICAVKLDGRSKEPLVFYFDASKFDSAPAARDQERTQLSELVEHADWVCPGQEVRATTAAATAGPSRLNLKRAIQPGRFVFVKNHQANFVRTNMKRVSPDAPFFWVAKVARIRGTEASLDWYREGEENCIFESTTQWRCCSGKLSVRLPSTSTTKLVPRTTFLLLLPATRRGSPSTIGLPVTARRP